MINKLPEIKVGDLVRHLYVFRAHAQKQIMEDRVGLHGVVVKICETKKEQASWSPLTVDVMWSDGILTKGYLASALEIIQD